MTKSPKKKASIIFDIITWIIVIVSVFVTVISLSSKESGVPSVMGKVLLSIQTNSMEPTIKPGDLILTEKFVKQELNKDDIISFFSIEQGQKIIKTHRIDNVKKINNVVTYITKGDNNPVPDGAEVPPGDIVSVYYGLRVGSLGSILDFLKSQWGFFIFIIVPLFIFLLYQLYVFIILIIENKKEQIINEANGIFKE